uniref:KOW domain-containing protein n=1 Tax=Amphimedon queenslandica TaxID=400682 RepID=A0A1X7SL01_AMPQE
MQSSLLFEAILERELVVPSLGHSWLVVDERLTFFLVLNVFMSTTEPQRGEDAKQMPTSAKVQILCGKDKGRNGKVVAVARRTNRVFVGGLNTHIRVMVGETARTRIASEAPLHVSNVALVDPED